MCVFKFYWYEESLWAGNLRVRMRMRSEDVGAYTVVNVSKDENSLGCDEVQGRVWENRWPLIGSWVLKGIWSIIARIQTKEKIRENHHTRLQFTKYLPSTAPHPTIKTPQHQPLPPLSTFYTTSQPFHHAHDTYSKVQATRRRTWRPRRGCLPLCCISSK